MKNYTLENDTEIKTMDFTQTSIINYEKEYDPIIDDGFVDLQRELHALDLS